MRFHAQLRHFRKLILPAMPHFEEFFIRPMEALLKPVALPFNPVFMMLPFDTVRASCYSFFEKLRALIAEELYFRICKDSRLFIKKAFLSPYGTIVCAEKSATKNSTRRPRPPIYIVSHISFDRHVAVHISIKVQSYSVSGIFDSKPISPSFTQNKSYARIKLQ